MAVSDACLGKFGVTISCTVLGYIFLQLMIVPILPLSDDYSFNYFTPAVLCACGLFSFIVIATLLLYTLLVLCGKG